MEKEKKIERRAERWRVLMERLISRINNIQFFFLSILQGFNLKKKNKTYFFLYVYLQGRVEWSFSSFMSKLSRFEMEKKVRMIDKSHRV
jgi:hypothetical protein